VELFHHSWKKARDLREKQQVLGLLEHKLLGDVVTCWGSTLVKILKYVVFCDIFSDRHPLAGAVG